ncbi:hypothetical protein BgiBS90_019333 [Biomphalaria glabrata]|nr:hypothetical protein BgiBS90_019333 [Biomphalaria glabrata]
MYFITFLVLSCFSNVDPSPLLTSQCGIGKEGQNDTLVFIRWKQNYFLEGYLVLSHQRSHFTEVTEVAHCSETGLCKLIETSFSSHLTINNVATNGTILLKIVFQNISRTLAGYWIIKYSGLRLINESSTCFLYIYAKPEATRCKYEYIIDNATSFITCTANKVYPAAKCVFLFTGYKETFAAPQESVLYRNHTYREVPVYYQTTCTLRVNSNVTKFEYNVTVFIFPNVTNNNTDIQFGTTINVNVKPEQIKDVSWTNATAEIQSQQTDNANESSYIQDCAVT